MDITARTITEYVDALETAKADAEHHLTTLGEACRRAIVDLSNALEALTNGHQSAPHAQEPEAEPQSAAPEPRMSREESKRRNDGIDKAVLSVLTECRGEELTVATIAGRLATEGMAVDNRGVSISLQRILQRILKEPRLGWSLIPGKKGRWRAEAKLETSQPAENGTHAEHRLDPEEPPFDPADGEAKLPTAGSDADEDASALEEAGVVAGGADPTDYGWR